VAMTRARERLLLSGAAKLEGWVEGNPSRVGGGPIAAAADNDADRDLLGRIRRAQAPAAARLNALTAPQ